MFPLSSRRWRLFLAQVPNRGPGDGRPTWRRSNGSSRSGTEGHAAERSDAARGVSLLSALDEDHAQRTCVGRRRCCPCPQPRRWPGSEYGTARCVQPRLEARAHRGRASPARAARHVPGRARADRDQRAGAHPRAGQDVLDVLPAQTLPARPPASDRDESAGCAAPLHEPPVAAVPQLSRRPARGSGGTGSARRSCTGGSTPNSYRPSA